ncbi:MAG: RNA polymerase sigma factor [Bryobacterales bacterium]|nr:RNA polymerase sigma factor [Bryobacterales bacterium]
MGDFLSSDLAWDQPFSRVSGGSSRLVESIHQLYLDVRAPLRNYLQHAAGAGAQEAEDIIQEAFVQLLSEILHGKTIRNPRPWAFRVAYHIAIDRLHRAGREASASIDEAHSTAAPEANAEEQLLLDERGQRVHNALALLTPQERQCLELRAEGLRYREIGDVLGLQVSTVSTFVLRAVKKISRSLERRPEDPA